MHALIDSSARREAAVSPGRALLRLYRAVGAAADVAPLEELPRRVAALLPELLAIDGLLTAAQTAPPAEGYRRAPIFLCPRDRFSVIAMIWPAGVATPVHDHRDWCAFGLYRGEIEETRYDPADSSPDCATAAVRQVLRHKPGAVAHLPVAAPNIHRISNPTGEAAISIHVYGGNCDISGPNLDRIYSVEA